MKKLLAAVVAAVFSITAAAPVIAADRPEKKQPDKKDKKDKTKKDEKKTGNPPPKSGFDQKKNKKQ